MKVWPCQNFLDHCSLRFFASLWSPRFWVRWWWRRWGQIICSIHMCGAIWNFMLVGCFLVRSWETDLKEPLYWSSCVVAASVLVLELVGLNAIWTRGKASFKYFFALFEPKYTGRFSVVACPNQSKPSGACSNHACVVGCGSLCNLCHGLTVRQQLMWNALHYLKRASAQGRGKNRKGRILDL